MTDPRSNRPPRPRKLRQGDLVNRTFRRDPLAVRYDTFAAQLVMRAIARQGDWVQAYVKSPEGEFGDPDRGGLTHHERAFLQACNYHRLVYRHAPGGWKDENGYWHQNENPDRTHALKHRWGGVEADVRVAAFRGPDGEMVPGEVLERGRGRLLEVRAIPAGEAALYASERYGR